MGLTEIKTETTPTQQRVETAKVVDDGGKDDTPGRKGATAAFGGDLVDGNVVVYVGDLSFSNELPRYSEVWNGYSGFFTRTVAKAIDALLVSTSITNNTKQGR